ncbi:MAG: T9SS C-terminal target domain-containing protein, partial [Calditrichaeota bacterium]
EHNRNAGIRAINAAPVIRSNAIIGNGPFGFESAIVLESSPAWISGNLIAYNSNSGIDIVNSSGVKILQNTVVKNDMGITITDSDPLIENNIIAMNGFGVSAENSTPKLLYNDVWQNPGGNFYNVGSGVGQFTHTNAQGDSVDDGENLQANPRFVDASNSDFRILVNSPCVDAGDPGNPALIKVVGMAPDIGAYENSGLSLPVELVSFRFENGYLVWTTASETNNFGFYVQRSSSPQGPFEKIAFVPGQGTRATPSHYRYRVDTPRTKTYFRLQQVDFDGSSWISAAIEVAGLPTQLQLAQNYPNPFVAGASTAVVSTRIRYLLPEAMPVDLAIYNLNGQRVKTLAHAPMQMGEHTARWNGRNEIGRPVARGIYFIRLKAGHSVLLKRMVLIR